MKINNMFDGFYFGIPALADKEGYTSIHELQNDYTDAILNRNLYDIKTMPTVEIDGTEYWAAIMFCDSIADAEKIVASLDAKSCWINNCKDVYILASSEEEEYIWTQIDEILGINWED